MNEKQDTQKYIQSIKQKLDLPVVFIGLMGAGKSRIGRLLAGELDIPFIDSDREIEKAAGCTIPEIFERDGEEVFRKAEHRIVSGLLDGRVVVLATGGGAVMNPETAELIWNNSVSIWLRAEIDVLLKRTAGCGNRPLLKQDNPEAVLRELAERRKHIYEKASIVVESNDVTQNITLNEVLRKLYEHLYDKD
jgi:shikimate kinase